jgi:Uma2 family endonuclease
MDSRLLRSEELGIKLEFVAGLPIWEASPVIAHQEAVDQIRASIKKSPDSEKQCGCFHYADIYVHFPEGSLKRPDISIFCEKPLEREEAVTKVPDAVIEILSKSYEKKDLDVSVPFYISQGIKDILVFNPYTMEVLHFSNGKKRELISPGAIEFACGCTCAV